MHYLYSFALKPFSTLPRQITFVTLTFKINQSRLFLPRLCMNEIPVHYHFLWILEVLDYTRPFLKCR